MESNWGRQVFTYGMSSIGATLAARWNTFPQFCLTNAPEVGDVCRVWFIPLPDTDDLAWNFSFVPREPKGTFPYGLDVEPVVNM